eukprot:jgi/Chlat1/5415/Chrsp35S05224
MALDMVPNGASVSPKQPLAALKRPPVRVLQPNDGPPTPPPPLLSPHNRFAHAATNTSPSPKTTSPTPTNNINNIASPVLLHPSSPLARSSKPAPIVAKASEEKSA